MTRRGPALLAIALSATIGCGETDNSRKAPPNFGRQPSADEPLPDSDGEPGRPAAGIYDGRDYLPLESGRVLRYQVTWSPPIGEPRSARATSTLTGEISVAEKSYFKQVTTISGIPFSPTTTAYYRSAPEGVFQILEGDEDRPEWLYLPRAIKIGNTWRATTSQGELEFEAAGVEDVETPSGAYANCLKLSLTIKGALGTATEVQWLAPGAGFVKQVDRNPLFSSTTLLEEITQDDH